jgi:tetratricopeptide (TPR) repeat protein
MKLKDTIQINTMKNLMKIILFATLSLTCLATFAAAQATTCANDDYDCKVAYYTRQISASPNDGESYYSRGMAYKRLERYDEALADFTKYISTNPTSKEYLADGYGERANCYKALKDTTRAIADYNRALELFPSTTVYNNRGTLYLSQNDNANAIADFNHAIAIDAKDAEPYYNRAKVYSSQKQYNKAIADLDIYIKLNTTNIPFLADGYQNRSIAYSNLDNLTQALKDANSAIDLDPNVGSRFRNRANVYRKLGKTALAEADEQAATRLDN